MASKLNPIEQSNVVLNPFSSCNADATGKAQDDGQDLIEMVGEVFPQELDESTADGGEDESS